jgi:hypothetical protein
MRRLPRGKDSRRPRSDSQSTQPIEATTMSTPPHTLGGFGAFTEAGKASRLLGLSVDELRKRLSGIMRGDELLFANSDLQRLALELKRERQRERR